MPIENMESRHGGFETACLAADSDRHIDMELWEELLGFLGAMAKPREASLLPHPIEPMLEPETSQRHECACVQAFSPNYVEKLAM